MHNNGQETTTQLPINVSGNEFMLITFVHRDTLLLFVATETRLCMFASHAMI